MCQLFNYLSSRLYHLLIREVLSLLADLLSLILNLKSLSKSNGHPLLRSALNFNLHGRITRQHLILARVFHLFQTHMLKGYNKIKIIAIKLEPKLYF